MRKGWVLAGISLLALGACSEETSPTPTPEVEGEVRAVIGPAGGELVGAPGTDLEGVKLTIPEGALAEEVEVWIRPTFDGTPLPTLAERVGLQVEVGSDGALSKSASLTLPFDAGAVARFGETSEEVKVWVRGDEAWSLVDAASTSEGDVTIALDTFTTAAAGVKVTALSPSCGPTCDPSASAHFDAGSCGATSACITSIVSPRLVETFDFAVSAKDKLAFLSASGSGIVGIGYDPVTKASSATPELPLSTSTRLLGAFAGDAYVVGLGSAGNAFFSGTSKPKVVDVGSGLGALRLKSGVTLRFSRGAEGNLHVVNDGTGKPLNIPPLPIPSNANIASIDFVESPRDVSSILVIAVDRMTELKLDGTGSTLTQTAQVTLPSALQGSGSIQAAAGADSIIAILIGVRLAISRDATTFEVVDLPFSPSSVAVGSGGEVLVGAARSPELVVIDAAGVQKGLRLSDAASGSAELTGRIPRAIRPTSTGFAVLTQDRGFLMVELN